MELSDVTKEVEQENLVKEARRQEHAILQSMIPEHIIDFLVEEKRSKRRGEEWKPSAVLLDVVENADAMVDTVRQGQNFEHMARKNIGITRGFITHFAY